MQSFTTRPIELKKDIQTIFGMIDNPTLLNPVLAKFKDKIPSKKVLLREDGFTIDTGFIGEVTLVKSQSNPPHLVEYTSGKSPVPIKLRFNLSELSEDKTLGQITLEVNAPVFLSGLLRSKIEPALTEVANMLELVDFDRLLK